MPDIQLSDQTVEMVKEVAKEVAKDVYEDVGHPIAKPTGELVGLVPRAIKAALAPVEKWVLQREYNVAETKKLLEEKLQSTPPDLIQPPEPYIAVPALQYISYCMDNEELRDMYANLLANSMNSVVKNGVHPSFVEIIKQLSPDEAKILKYLYCNSNVPILGLRAYKKTGGSVVAVPLFTNLTEMCECENVREYERCIDNLTRLGLVAIPNNESLVDKSLYEPLKTHPRITAIKNALCENQNVTKVDYIEGHIILTAFGQSFCSVCVGTNKEIIGRICK